MDGLSDNEKKALGLSAEEGMKEMSEKYAEMGNQLYLDAADVNEKARCVIRIR